MKIFLEILMLVWFSIITVQAQPGPAGLEKMSMSFKDYYKHNHPSLNYSYDDSSQTHDYSGNWDFDADGKTDRLFFIGNGGAHVYFHLVIVLSSDNIARDFPFLEFDFPCLGSISELKKPGSHPQFVVHDFDSDGIDEIYLNLEIKYSPIPATWKKRGLTSRYILVDYKNKGLALTNFRLK